MEGVFEKTSLCPFTEMCESYKTIARSERWMEKILSHMRRNGLEELPKSEGGYTTYVLEARLGRMKRVKDRCYKHNKRCLRFWQFDRDRKNNRFYTQLGPRLAVLGATPDSVVAESQV